MFHYMNEKEVTFNVKYEIVLYTPVFNARCPPLPPPPWKFSENSSILFHASVPRMEISVSTSFKSTALRC